MLSDRALYLEMQRAKAQCRFVADISRMTGSADVVYIKLVDSLTLYLPKHKGVLVIDSAEFSIDLVREQYQKIVIDWLTEALRQAHELNTSDAPQPIQTLPEPSPFPANQPADAESSAGKI